MDYEVFGPYVRDGSAHGKPRFQGSFYKGSSSVYMSPSVSWKPGNGRSGPPMWCIRDPSGGEVFCVPSDAMLPPENGWRQKYADAEAAVTVELGPGLAAEEGSSHGKGRSRSRSRERRDRQRSRRASPSRSSSHDRGDGGRKHRKHSRRHKHRKHSSKRRKRARSRSRSGSRRRSRDDPGVGSTAHASGRHWANAARDRASGSERHRDEACSSSSSRSRRSTSREPSPFEGLREK